MKKIFATLGFIATMAMSSIAMAVPFTLSDVTFTTLTGNTEKPFTWSVASPFIGTTTLSSNVLLGSPWTFVYGTFTLGSDALINNQNQPIVSDNNDYFKVNFKVTPPTPAANPADTGNLTPAKITTNTAGVTIDFDNAPIEIFFANGGKYQLTFLDALADGSSGHPALYKGDSLNLEAKIELVNAPVPEPGTMVLLGFGMLGLAIYGKRRMNN